MHRLLLLAPLLIACTPEMTATPLPSDAGPGPAPMAPGDAGPPPTTPVPDARCPADTSARFAEIAASFTTALDAAGAPGGTLSLVCGDQNLVSTHGVRRRGGTEPVTSSTRFQLASTSKMFTGMLAAALAAQGRVDANAPVRDAVPGAAWGDATLEQLLAHTASYPTEFDAWGDDLATLIGRNRAQALWAEPGAVWNYSNPGFSVAGHVLALRGGGRFADLMREHVLAPAGMQATFDVNEVMAGDYAAGHGEQPPYQGVIEPDGAYFHTEYYAPMGGLWASGDDMVRWLEVELGRGGIAPAVVARAQTPVLRTTNNGQSYGWGHFVETGISPTIVHHGGSSPGYLGTVQVVPGAGFGVAVMVNAESVDVESIAMEAIERFVELRFSGGPVEPAPSLYVGRYEDPQVFGRIEVTEESGQLVARFLDRGTQATLTPYYGEAYETQYDGETIDVTFWRDGDGPATHLVSLWGIAKRTP